MPTDLEIPSHLNIRIDPKVRYLTEIAARARNMTVTEYVEAALNESFKRVYLTDEAEEPLLSLKERREELAPPVESLAHYADALWSDNPGVRLAIRAGAFNHLMSEADRVIFDYILAQKDLAPKGRLNQRAIAERWSEIKTKALTEDVEARKAGKK